MHSPFEEVAGSLVGMASPGASAKITSNVWLGDFPRALFKGRSMFYRKQLWELFALDGLGPHGLRGPSYSGSLPRWNFDAKAS